MDKPDVTLPALGRIDRRGLLTAAAISPALLSAAPALAAPSGPPPVGGFKGAAPADLDGAVEEFFSYLEPLKDAVRELANTWRPNDPAYRANLFRQVMMNLSFGYFVYFNADAEHPDWSPLYNPVFACQPNPDDIYLLSPIR